MRNKYPGMCYFCNIPCAVGQGHFERFKGSWRTIHADCVFKQREMKLNLMSVGNPIDFKPKRLAAGLTQQEVADRLGVSLRTYRRYENLESKPKKKRYKDIMTILKAGKIHKGAQDCINYIGVNL